jgi:hypothetical protein
MIRKMQALVVNNSININRTKTDLVTVVDLYRQSGWYKMNALGLLEMHYAEKIY